MTINCFFDHFNTPEVHELRIGFEPAVERKADFPRPREYFGIFDRGFVLDRISRNRCVSLDNMQGVAMEIAGSIKPGIWGEAGDINDKCVALPMADRVAHVCVGGIRRDIVEMDGPLSICEFEDHHDLVRALNDLERVWQIHRARDARHVAFELWVTIQPVLSVLAPSLSRPGLIWNLVALDDYHARWPLAHRSECH